MGQFFVLVQRMDEDAEKPDWVLAGHMSAMSMEGLSRKLMDKYNLSWDELEDVERGGWGGRPDDYLLLIANKAGKAWGTISITDASFGVWPTEVLNHSPWKKYLKKPFPQRIPIELLDSSEEI